MVKVFFILIISVVLIICLYVGGNILYGTLTDYKPLPTESLELENAQQQAVSGNTFSLLIWNIGFGGLGHQEDFFYDGAKMPVKPVYSAGAQFIDLVTGKKEVVKFQGDVHKKREELKNNMQLNWGRVVSIYGELQMKYGAPIGYKA